jgi:hypothetical protein
MKTNLHHFDPARRRREGSATFLFIALLAIMLVLVTSNVRTIMQLQAEERLVEQKQIQRLNLPQNNVAGAQRLEPK